VRETTTNILATLDRRPEAYHVDIIAATSRDGQQSAEQTESASAPITFKQPGLDNPLVYDRYPRKALVDHFFPLDVGADDLVAGREAELGDFVLGTYLAKVQRERERVAVVMERRGRVGGHPIRLRKTITLLAGEAGLSIHYELEELPADVCLHFGVEFNLAAMAGHAPDRFYSDMAGVKLGMLDERIDLPHTHGLFATDQWLGLCVGLTWSQAASLWCFPIRTVSQSEGGIEGVYQSSAIIPHWHVTADEHGRWDVRLRWNVESLSHAISAPKPGIHVVAGASN
jgi:hypothetical protein